MGWKSSIVSLMSRLLRPGTSSRCLAAVLSPCLKLAGPRRDIARRNIRFALPEASARDIDELVAAGYEHLVWVGLEMLALQRNPQAALEWVDAQNADLLRSCYGQGAILLTGHVGNWELSAAWIAQQGYEVTAIVRESDDREERGLIEELRANVGVKSLPKSAPMTRAVSILKRGEFLGILPDQHAGHEGMMVPFFGRETSTYAGSGVLAYLTGKPLIPIFSHRIEPFRHQIRVGSPIEWKKLENREATIMDIMIKVNRSVEEMVREAPGQWLSAHKRFKEYY